MRHQLFLQQYFLSPSTRPESAVESVRKAWEAYVIELRRWPRSTKVEERSRPSLSARLRYIWTAQEASACRYQMIRR